MKGTQGRRIIVGIIGGARGSDRLMAEAEAIGAALMAGGYRLACGGLGGVMAAACRGARGAPGWEEGRIIGVLPSLRAEDANPCVDIVIPTGMSYARNVILVAMSDVLVAVGGGAGTLSEMALAWQHHKPIIALDLGEGWSARLAGEALDERREDILHPASSSTEVLTLVQSLASLPRAHVGF